MKEIVHESNKLTVKDLVTTGIFTALYFAFLAIGMCVFAPNPVLTFVSPCASALFTGPVILLLMAKTHKHGPMIILGAIIGLILYLTGMHWGWAAASVLLGVVADLIAGVKDFRSVKLNIISYIIFSLHPMGSFIFLWINRNKYFGYLVKKGTEQSYVDKMNSIAKPWMLPVMFLSVILTATISALVGRAMLKKQFEKAGITA